MKKSHPYHSNKSFIKRVLFSLKNISTLLFLYLRRLFFFWNPRETKNQGMQHRKLPRYRQHTDPTFRVREASWREGAARSAASPSCSAGSRRSRPTIQIKHRSSIGSFGLSASDLLYSNQTVIESAQSMVKATTQGVLVAQERLKSCQDRCDAGKWNK